MKKVILILLLVSASIKVFSQIDHIEILLGMDDSQVTNYFDSLNNLKKNQYYKVKKDVNADGNLILSCSFSLADESYYKCLYIHTVFERVDGKEICALQALDGSTQYAQSNLAFIKDNFETVSDGVWEKYYTDPTIKAKISAKFKREGGEYPHYFIKYEIVDK